MRWLPAFRWHDIDLEETMDIGLPVHWRWQLLAFEWLDFGLFFYARQIGLRDWGGGSR